MVLVDSMLACCILCLVDSGVASLHPDNLDDWHETLQAVVVQKESRMPALDFL